MTKKEARDMLIESKVQLEIIVKLLFGPDADLAERVCFDKAIEVLDQESVLDKIRAEIEPKCDRINSLASVLPYTSHREIQELLLEIMDLCKAESDEA